MSIYIENPFLETPRPHRWRKNVLAPNMETEFRKMPIGAKTANNDIRRNWIEVSTQINPKFVKPEYQHLNFYAERRFVDYGFMFVMMIYAIGINPETSKIETGTPFYHIKNQEVFEFLVSNWTGMQFDNGKRIRKGDAAYIEDTASLVKIEISRERNPHLSKY